MTRHEMILLQRDWLDQPSKGSVICTLKRWECGSLYCSTTYAKGLHENSITTDWAKLLAAFPYFNSHPNVLIPVSNGCMTYCTDKGVNSCGISCLVRAFKCACVLIRMPEDIRNSDLVRFDGQGVIGPNVLTL
jgi:hypothetical protein